VVVLLTDGETTRGVLDPRTAAEAAAAFGIRIYTIGVGTEGEARMPIGRGVQGQLRYQTLPVRLDEPLLRDIAASTGGRYFRATDPEALNRIFRQIDQLEKTPVITTRYTQFDEAVQLPILVGLGALALELLLAATVIVRVP
jgi:Ca-activated chloride channel family protein